MTSQIYISILFSLVILNSIAPSQSAPRFSNIYGEFQLMSNTIQFTPQYVEFRDPVVKNLVTSAIPFPTNSPPLNSLEPGKPWKETDLEKPKESDPHPPLTDSVDLNSIATVSKTAEGHVSSKTAEGQDTSSIMLKELNSIATISKAMEGQEAHPIVKDEHTAEVTLFGFNNRRGNSQKFEVKQEECVTLPKPWRERVLSVNTHGTCVQLCEKQNCRGRCVKVKPGSVSHNRLRDIDFDKRTSSLKSC